MNRILLATTAALIAAGSSFAIAQNAGPGQRPGPGGPGGPGGPRMERLTKEDMSSLVDARIAAIQAGLKFTPEQQKLWQPVEALIRKTAAERAERFEAMRGQREAMQALTPEQRRERMRERMTERRDFGQRLDRMGERAAAMKTFADTVKPLYASLDERQKRLFPMLMRPAGGQRMAGWHGGRGGEHRGGGHDGHHRGERL